MLGHRIKKNISLSIASVAFILTTPTFAQTTETTTTASTSTGTQEPSKSEGYLKEIRDILLLNINKLPVYLNQLTKMSLSWLTPDDSSSTAKLQNSFTMLANERIQNAKTHNESQTQFLNAFLGRTAPKNVSEITYQTLFNPPPPPTAANPTQNEYASFMYTMNASGLNIQHAPPQTFWNETTPAVILYKNYYYTTAAVQTYNGYILSELFANAKNENKVKKTQDSLIQQASSSDWFTQIASENIGVVLRQILLYNSQTYVLLTQMQQTQQKLLEAQVMNNALLIAVNQEAENRLYSKAAGMKPV